MKAKAAAKEDKTLNALTPSVTVLEFDGGREALSASKASYVQMLLVICHSDPTASNMARLKDARSETCTLKSNLDVWYLRTEFSCKRAPGEAACDANLLSCSADGAPVSLLLVTPIPHILGSPGVGRRWGELVPSKGCRGKKNLRES